ncbi:DUF305 domain-containing protein [Streptomyces anulatus]|uniref:DUF305 domain-containing protein n=1 Tax=Streptomyces anulatus TaxID=1892 RepID=UPI0004C74398|nr:DUF305 domain-containing protein [Streptomyces anulatus]
MNATPFRLRRRAALATASTAVAALALTACGDDGNSSATSAPPPATASAPATVPTGEHNQADVTFAQGMIPHHRQAILMSEMAQTHAASDEVKALAAKIKKAQDPEIATMTGWLKAWGEKVPTGMDGMDGGDHDGSGMMDDQRMDMLRGASGTAFDTMFLTMMIEHHEGAVEMAKTEKAEGAYGPAKTLADDIITAQTTEIAQMKTMLGKS